MKLIKIVDAYLALGILSKCSLPFKDALKITFIKGKIKPSYEFFAAEEKSLVMRICAKDEKGYPIKTDDGGYAFKDEQSKEEYLVKMKELADFEVDTVDPITITPPEKISASVIEALDGFVKFEEAQNAS